MRNVIITGSDITAVIHVELTKEMARAIEKRPFQLKGLLKDLHATDGVICTDKDQNPIFEMSIRMPNVFTMQREMTGFEMREQQFIQEISKWVKEDISHKAANKKAMKDKPEDEVYVCLKRMKQGYKIQGNMPLEEVVQALASMFISYAANKK